MDSMKRGVPVLASSYSAWNPCQRRGKREPGGPPPAREPGARAQQPAAPAAAPKQIVGTVKSIGNGKTDSTHPPDAGASVVVQVLDNARILRAEPGQTDLKDAAKISMAEVQAGDRILVLVRVVPTAPAMWLRRWWP